MALLRRVIGDALRARRQGLHRTLREVSIAANVSLGYLSEIERGQKEASSELLASICEALGSQLSEVLREASDSLAQTEHADIGLGDTRLPERSLPEPALSADSEVPEQPLADSPAPLPAARTAPVGAFSGAESRTVTDGEVSVSVHRDGPLRTRLHAVRSGRGKSVSRAG